MKQKMSKELMKIEKNYKYIYRLVISYLFFFFFCSPALSPAIGGNTIYLHWILALLDWNFIRFCFDIVKRKSIQRYLSPTILLLLSGVVTGRVFVVLKICSIIWCILYLSYSKREGFFKYLYVGMNINIVVAIIQFVLFYINPGVAYKLGPTNISKLIWGNYATLTNTNMYAIFGNKLVRVCGWSREAGFFASLLMICFLCYMYDTKIEKRRFQYILFALGFVISFSKVSLLILPLFLVLKLSKFINKIQVYCMVALYGFITTIFAEILYKINYLAPEHESMAHRFIGYHVVWRLRGREAILGFGTLEKIGEGILEKYSILRKLISRGYDSLCGWAGIVEYLGFLGLVLWVIGLVAFGVNASGIIFVMLATFTVDPFTATSFVVLAYWMVLDLKILNTARQ